MKVAHVGNYKPGTSNGVNQTIAGLVDHLPSHGVDVELWHFTSKVKRVTERASSGARVWDIPAFGSRLANALLLTEEAKRFLAARAREVDLLHLHSVFVPENAWTARLGVPYVLTPNGGYGTPVLGGRRRRAKRVWMRLRERSIWEQCRVLHAVSPSEAIELRRLADRVPIRFIPNGVSGELTELQVSDPSDSDYLLFLGRLATEHKGLDILLHGYQLALRAAPDTLPRLVIAGPDFRGGLRELERLVSSLGIASRVSFQGPVAGAEKWKLLGQARAFIHTSRWEGMPFALLEAMALGRSVLVTPGTNLGSFVRESDCGVVVEPAAESVAFGLAEIAAATPELLSARGANARRLVRDTFAWPAVAAQMAATYTELS